PEAYTNGAVTDLGFAAGEGKPQHSAAQRFFVQDVSLSATVDVIAPTITASASLGFLGLDITGNGSIVGHIGFSPKDPEGITADDPTGTKVAVKTLIDALSKGHFLFDASNEGPDNGVIDPITSLAAGLELSANPTGAIAGLGSLGSITVSLDV